MREELFWDVNTDRTAPETIIERTINFGGLDFIEAVQKEFGLDAFLQVLKLHRNLSKRKVNYWCLKLGLDRDRTRTFQDHRIWEPMR